MSLLDPDEKKKIVCINSLKYVFSTCDSYESVGKDIFMMSSNKTYQVKTIQK